MFNMPRSYARRKINRSRRVRRTAGKRFAKKIKSVVHRALRSNVEVKKYMSSQVETTMTSVTPGVNWLQFATAIAKGTGSEGRIGDKVKIVGIKMDYYLINNTNYPAWVRECFIRLTDKEVVNDTTGILMGTSNQGTDIKTTVGMASMMRQFHPTAVSSVYRNKVYKLPGNTSTDAMHVRKVRFFKKFPKGLSIQYNPSALGALYTEPNICWGIWCADAGEDANAITVEISYQYTIYYTDA